MEIAFTAKLLEAQANTNKQMKDKQRKCEPWAGPSGWLRLLQLAWRLLLRRRASDCPAQVALILGGCARREMAAAQQLVRSNGPIPLLLSSGASTELQLRDAVLGALPVGVPPSPVLIDSDAVDTVTNFTSVASALAACGIERVAIATARDHCARAFAVGVLVFGSHGLAICQVHPVDAEEALSESALRTIRDVLRAIAFVLTGFHLGSLNQLVHPQRVAAATSWRRGQEQRGRTLSERLREVAHTDCDAQSRM
eukprot:CAMPEP_0183356782 /NCGR_PEP_ID=MMETSP0164_2-20130417/45188_1 /TAXON_ID=221442 /ORGANISM="Coccolithus pelagicus ssp braarudi, Strain PLY182g" /LENGTH=253 /DNA_ID=CAMNT_0025530273 /DNA_START=323 /DNA_END=1084 /DNA_ORIENTATION=+